ncbi:antibiotic biosynthesis monooxygenase [Streptomyces sp. NPDC052051]|uniref:antibiotic biosynthesis monooxygenase family protein n=1 Tax=Streptomyces sp. NPDC052051 TaxID=3154649 RepID=UPI003443BBF6
MLYLRAGDTDAPEIEDAYHRISEGLAATPGLLGNELLRNLTEPGGWAVLSEWESLDAFHRWESGSAHRGTTSPLRPYQDRERSMPFALLEVTARH